MTDNGSPTEVLRYLLNSKFNVFLEYEKDPNITSSGRVMVSLVRSIFSHNPRNIRTALNRIDGVLPKQIDLQLPKVFYLYPNANPPEVVAPVEESTEVSVVEKTSEKADKPIPEMTVREATRELGKLPYSLVSSIMKDANATAKWFANPGSSPVPKKTPYLKSVIAAHFVEMAASGAPDVVEDFFDSIDGRLAETIKVGEDIYLTSYAKEAPEGAYLNEQGILMIEATKQQDMWGKALQKGKIINE